MKEMVYKAIQKSGKRGMRLRELGWALNVWHCSLLNYVVELENEGLIYSKTIGHGIEAYIQYYAKERA